MKLDERTHARTLMCGRNVTQRRQSQIASDTDSLSLQRAIHPFPVIECLLFSPPLSIHLSSSLCVCVCVHVHTCVCVYASVCLSVDNDGDHVVFIIILLIRHHVTRSYFVSC